MSYNQPKRRFSNSRFQPEINYDDVSLNTNEAKTVEKQNFVTNTYNNIAIPHDNVLKFLLFQNKLIETMESIVNGQLNEEVYKDIEEFLDTKNFFLQNNLDLFKQKISLDQELKFAMAERKLPLSNSTANSEEDLSIAKQEISAVKEILKKREAINEVFFNTKEEISKQSDYIKEDISILKYEEYNLSKKIEKINTDIKDTQLLNNERLDRITKLYKFLNENNKDIDKDVQMGI
ncbi:hypothetical protein QEN19_004424 [Hanseniaspora menglaensis]